MKPASIRRTIAALLTSASLLVSVRPLVGQDAEPESTPSARLELKPYRAAGAGSDWRHGTLEAFENRQTGRGRTISLYVLVLPAKSRAPAPDPIFVLHGGPGAAATTLAAGLAESWLRRDRDIVLVDQRGTGRSNPLHVALAGSADNLQGYLDPIFQVDLFRRGKERLERVADLRQYTTPIAMDDLDDVRRALGYQRINLVGGSYGTRAALVYMRRHEPHVRTAILSGVVPLCWTNPLYHARSAQEGLDRIFDEVAADPAASKAFPHLREEFQEVLARLEEEPVEVTLTDVSRNVPVTFSLTRDAFSEALRVMMYYMPTNRKVPLLIHRASEGDFKPFIQTGIESNRRIRGIVAFGMLMSVVGSEDIPRITEEAILRETRGTFLRDVRVRNQMAVAKIWPRGDIPEGYGRPVRAKTPTLLISGTHDPVTPPRWGEEAARHLPNSLHLVVPAVHGAYGAAVEKVKRDLLRTGTVEGLDVSEVKDTRMPPLELGDRVSPTD